MKSISIRRGVLLFAPLVWAQTAEAHGIAGNRYFDGTMTFDDPAVADEAILPFFTDEQYPTQGKTLSENRIDAAFARLLTLTLAFTVDSGWIYQNWPVGHTSGFDRTDIGLKYEAYRNNQHEALVSVSLDWALVTPARSRLGPMHPIRSSRASSSAKALAISPRGCLGCVRSRLRARSWMRFRLGRSVGRSRLTSRPADSTQ